MTQVQKRYDLEERTAKFAADVIAFTRHISFSTQANEIIRQVVRSACSIGANYIEANEALSKKDFLLRIKICRKEAKETTYWLRLLRPYAADGAKLTTLAGESLELTLIFGSIFRKSTG